MKVCIDNEHIMKVLLAPHISEKSTVAADKRRQYVFKVLPDATKPEIKRAVEKMFNVKVDRVQVANVKAKTKRVGRIMGRSKAWKKAYVKLQEGHDIDFGGHA